MNHSYTNTPRCTQYTAVFWYLPVFYKLLEHQHFLNRCVVHAVVSSIYFGRVVTKLDNASCGWHGSAMVWTLIIHTLAMSVYYVHRRALAEDWFRGGHMCITGMYRGSKYSIASCTHMKLVSGSTNLSNDPSATLM